MLRTFHGDLCLGMCAIDKDLLRSMDLHFVSLLQFLSEV